MAESLREQVRAAISNAYYQARNAGQTMEDAADAARDAVLTAVRDNLLFPANGDGLNEYRDALCEWLS